MQMYEWNSLMVNNAKMLHEQKLKNKIFFLVGQLIGV